MPYLYAWNSPYILHNKYKGLKAQLDLIKTANQALRDEQV